MRRSRKIALSLSLLILLAAEKPEPLTPEEQREQKIIERFQTVLEKNPRRGTALDRIYGYHVERGSLDKLIGEYRERAKKDANDGVASLIVGLLEAQRGRDAEAVAAFREAEKRLPNNALTSYYLGQALVMVGQPDAAAEAFERAIDRKPGRTDLLDIFQALGRVYQRAQRSDKALAVWSRLEQLFPDDRRVQEQIASTLAEEGQFEAALPRYENLAKQARDPYQKATFRMEAAELKVRLKQTAKALADFESLLGELNPDSWLYREVRRKIEDVFLRGDDLAGLAKYYEGWVEKNPADIDAIARLARTLSNQGRMPEARTWLEKALVKAPSRRELRQALIEQLVFEQKYGEAAAQYEAMDKNDPNNPDTLREWGKLLLRDTARPEAQRKQDAYAVWKRLLERRPKDPVVTAQVADLVRSAGMTDEAIALYQRAIELAPDSPQYREYLGEYYHNLKRSDEAFAAWRPIAAGDKRNAKNLARLGEVFGGFGYRKEAIAAFADAVKLQADDFNLRVRYAELLHLEGRHDDALAQLDEAAKLISNSDEAESILQAQIKIYQANDTLTARTEALQKELDAPSPQPLSPKGERGARGEGEAERRHRLARYYEANRQMAEATAAIGKAMELDAKSLPILASAARIHETGGNLLLAANTNRKLAALDRRFRTEYLTAVAKLEARLGRRAEALQAGRDLLAAAPGNPDHYKFFADLCFQLGESEEGLESLRRSVRANPSEPQGLLTLANALAERFRTGEAIELCWRAFDKTNDLDGKLPIVTRLTELYLLNNQFDRLLERLERERREADKQREMTLCLAQAYQAAGDLGTARRQLEHLLAENARDTQLLSQLSLLSENEGDNALALKYQRQFVQVAPNSHDGRLRLAQLLVKAGEAEEAATIWVKLVADEPQPHRNLQAIDALFGNNKPETVLAITRRLLTQKPGNWELLYREGAALAALNKTDEASQHFQALLDLRLSDDDEGAILKANKKQKIGRVVSSSTATPTPSNNQTYNPDEVPLEVRTDNVWQIRAYTGMDPRYVYYLAQQQQQQRTWMPRDYGQARLAALGWLLGFAQKQGRGEAFLKARRPAGQAGRLPKPTTGETPVPPGQAGRLPKPTTGETPVPPGQAGRLQQLRQDWREVYKAARELAQSPDPAAQWAYLHSLASRTVTAGRYLPPKRANAKDATPSLPKEEIDRILASFQRLRKEKPQWLTSNVLTNVLSELKRARRVEDEEQVYRDAVATATTSGQLAIVQNVLNIAAERGDLESVLTFFERVDRMQGGAPQTRIGTTPIRQAAEALGEAMRARADAKGHDGIPRLYQAYLTASRHQHQASGRVASKPLSTFNQTSYSVYVGRSRQYVQIDFPQPNDYLDAGAIELLRNAFELYKRDDLLSDLFAHYRKELDKAAAADKIYLRLTLAALHSWNHELEESLAEMNAAGELAPGDVNLRLEVARLRENNNEPAEALAVLDGITPLDHTTMQQREIAALRLAVRTGNVERARQAADRLFGLRLDAETQVKLAAQMHQLGMHDAAEKVLQRAQRQAGHRTAALIGLMHQYQSQNQIEPALQIARKLLRKAPSTKFMPFYWNNESDGRDEAIQVLVRSGKLADSIARAEAQLKSSPQSLELHQTLLEYYKATGDKAKIKDIAERMAKVRPDDGKMRFQLAEQLDRIGELAAAADHYRAGIRKEPTLFAFNYWEIQRLFDRLHKTEELIQLIEEIDFKAAGGNYFAFMNLLQPLFKQERTRAQGLRLLRKVWDAFPQERGRLLGYIYEDELWQMPEIYDYARQAVLPVGDDPVDPWQGSDQIVRYSGDGRVVGVVTRLLEAARRQNRLRPLARDIERALVKRPEWSAGKAILAILNLQRGRSDEARRAWRELLDDKKNPMPLWSRYILGQEIADFESMRDLALETYEGAIEETINDMNMNFGYSPLRRLAHLYRDLGRKQDARALLLRSAQSPGFTFNAGYAAYQRILNTSALADALTELGYPVDALRLCSELLNDSDTIQAAMNWNGPWMKQEAEQALRTAVKGLKPETLAEAVRDLLTPQTSHSTANAAGSSAVLDLLLLLQPRELPDARLKSMLEQALHEAKKKPELRTEARAALKKLLTEHPDDLSVRIVAALEAGLDDKSEQLADTVEKLTRIVDAQPLEKLAKGQRANARQRAEAARQLGIWLIARECLRRPALRAAGAKLGERAVEAARRQLEPHFALAMLREWGQIELDRGDRRAAERRWAEMLSIVLPAPVRQKKTTLLVPTLRVGTHVRTLRVPSNSRDVLLVRAEARDAKARDAERPDVRSHAERGNEVVVAVTIEQFENAARVAMLTAEQKMFALSLRSLRDALRGGPPVSGTENVGQRRILMAGGNPAPANENGEQHNQTVAQQASVLVGRWQRGGVAAKDIYDALAGAVLPEARPAEVFFYAPTSIPDPSQPGLSVGQLLVAAAVKAERLDDLRRRVAARQDKPLGELNARVLLAQIAAAAKDEPGLRAALTDFGQRLQKDNLQHTAVLVCQATAPLLANRELAALARPVLERAAKNLIAAGNEDAAGNVLIFLARHDFEQGRTKEGQSRLKEATGLTRRTGVRDGVQGSLNPRMQRVALEYLRADLLGDALDLLGVVADAPAEQRTRTPDDMLHNLPAAFARQFAKHPAKERYDLLKSWTLPTATRQSVRILAGFAPMETPPAVFGKFAAPPAGVVSMPDLLIEAARQTGKLAELAVEVEKSAANKVENADILYAIIQLADGKGATVEDVVKRQIEQVRKKVMAPPPIRSPFYYGGPEMSGPSVEWTEFLLARACLRDAGQSDRGETLADLLLWLAEGRSGEPSRTQRAIRFVETNPGNSNWAMVIHLREEVARRVGRAERDPPAGLRRWHPAGYSDTAGRRGGALPPWWIAHEGHVAHLLGAQDDFLIFDYPLTGTFEFSVDAYQGGWAEGHVGYAGMVFEPLADGGNLWPVGGHERLSILGNALRRDSFNRFTIRVAPDKVRWLVNNRLVHEQTDVSSTSPWLALYASRDRHTVFRNPQLRGEPHIPREVQLSHGDRLEGWVNKFYDESQPPRWNKNEEPRNRFAVTPSSQNRDPSSFDWHARDGEIHGRHDSGAAGRNGSGSLLSYFRPLRPGETLRYEFFYRPGEVMVHPCLGRLAFLLEPERVCLHWLADNDGNDWTGLSGDNAIDIGGEAKTLPFKTDAWNRLQLSITADAVKIELNGIVVCEHKLEANHPRPFGLFHDKNSTAAQVRNVVLTGDWPKTLGEPAALAAGFHERPTEAARAGAVRRALIGDRFFLQNAGPILRQARELPDDKAYALLSAWVLPSDGHPMFQLAGEFTPADPAPPATSSPLPSGRRVPTGGDIEAPALQLVTLAKKLGKLDDLAERIEQAKEPALARGRLAMLALVRAAQERDEPARKALEELGRLIAPLSLNEPTWRRWPELLAALGTRYRPALREPALALLDIQVKKLEESIVRFIPLPDRDSWLSHVRQTHSAIQVLRLPLPHRPFGDDPGLKFWDAVSYNQAMPRGLGAPRTHWTVQDGVVRHYPGRSHDYLYLRTPLQGDFDVSCELTSFGRREAQLAYGGLRFDLVYTLKRYNLFDFTRLIRATDIDPPLPDPGPWYKFRLIVRGDTYTVSINDRKMCDEPLPLNADPWLMLHAEHSYTAGVRNLKIDGKPRVPESLSLSASPDLAGWLSYYDDKDWRKRGEEIAADGSRPAQDADQPPRPRTWQEKALHYHRPLLEDGEIDYDFYYEPGKVLGHPVVDRLVFLLDPEGVRIHWLTDGVHDRTGLPPDNAVAEPKNRRGPEALPFKPKTWNHMKLSLSGDTITLHLNGKAIYERALESTNQRTFGLFHYADDTSIRVRNVLYRGQWPRRLPDAKELWEAREANK